MRQRICHGHVTNSSIYYSTPKEQKKGPSVPAEPGRTVPLLKSNPVAPILLHDQLLRLICFGVLDLYQVGTCCKEFRFYNIPHTGCVCLHYFSSLNIE